MFTICFKCFPGCVKSDNMEKVEEEEKDMTEKADMSDDSKSTQKITGYLEKKCKLKLMNSWKRYWFVLKGNLLLYYGSKEEYDALSPVKGRITLGPTCNVKPYPSTPEKFQITSRSGKVITLRAETTSEQNKWMKAIYSVVNENQKVEISPTKLNHFRYSTERIDALMKNTEQRKGSPSPVSVDIRTSPKRTLDRENSSILERVQRMGGRSYCNSALFHNQQRGINSPIDKFNLELNERLSRTDHSLRETGRITPKKQFSPVNPKIHEEPKNEKEKIIIEDEDYCVCSFEKNQNNLDSSTVEKTSKEFKIESSPKKSPSSNSCEQNQKTNQDHQRSPREKLRILREKILISKPTAENTNERFRQTEDNKYENNIFGNKSEDKSIDKEEKSEIEETEKTSEDNTKQNYIKISANNQVNSDKEKKEFTTPNEEPPSSYQDFRENELYAIPSPSKQTKRSSEELLPNPEEAQARRDLPNFEFPPPPIEAYESALDLTSRNEDTDSLYEEAEDDFVWQNEIYASSVSGPDKLYAEPNVEKDIEQNLNRTELKHSSIEKFEAEKDLYEEVDKDFTYQTEERNKFMLKTFDSDKSLYEVVDTDYSCPKSPFARGKSLKEDFQRPRSLVQFENDIYEIVDTEPGKIYQDTIQDGEKQIDNELYAQVDSVKISKFHTLKTEEKDKDNLYTKPDKKTNRERIISHDEDSCHSTEEIKLKNNSYDKQIFNQGSRKMNYTEIPFAKKDNLEIENDLYAVPNEVFHNDCSQKQDNYEKHEKENIFKEEVEIENDLYAVPNEVLSKNSSQSSYKDEQHREEENDLYAVPNEILNKEDNTNNNWGKYETNKHTEKNVYAEPNHNSRQTTDKLIRQENTYSEPTYTPTEVSKKPIFSRQNSKTDTHQTDKIEHNKSLTKSPESSSFKSNFLDKLLHKKTKHEYSTDEENSVDLENELYTEKACGTNQSEKYDLNVYEDPDVLLLRPEKREENTLKKKKLRKTESSKSKGKDEKKHDTFILRLLKQATRKHDKEDKAVDLATRDESLALLAEIQVLLEKKKKEIKAMVSSSPKPSHRRYLSDSHATHTTIDQCSASSLKKSMSIDLNDEYSLVLDNIEDQEVIYSEVEMANRNSKELKDLIEEILKKNKKSTSECRPSSYADR